MAIPPPIIPVPELIRAARTSAGLQRHAIPNVAIPIRIKTTAHTCELIAFKLSTNPMTTPGCLRDSQHLEFATSTSTQHQPFANALECVTSTLLCVLLGASLSIAPKMALHQCIARNVYAPAGGAALDVAALQKCNKTVFAALAYPFTLRLPRDAGGRIDPRLSVALIPLTVNV
jgi:hypothetical protein